MTVDSEAGILVSLPYQPHTAVLEIVDNVGDGNDITSGNLTLQRPLDMFCLKKYAQTYPPELQSLAVMSRFVVSATPFRLLDSFSIISIP